MDKDVEIGSPQCIAQKASVSFESSSNDSDCLYIGSDSIKRNIIAHEVFLERENDDTGEILVKKQEISVDLEDGEIFSDEDSQIEKKMKKGLNFI